MLSGGGQGFAPALSLQTLKLIHGAIKLPVQVSFVAEQVVRCIRGGGEWCQPFGEFRQREAGRQELASADKHHPYLYLYL